MSTAKRVKVTCPGCGAARRLRASSAREYGLRGVTPHCHPCAWRLFRRHGNSTPRPAAEPTGHPPGSPEKVAVMAGRFDRGESVFHPADRTNVLRLRELAALMGAGS